VEYLTDCHRKAQFLNTVLYSERNREEKEARRTKVQMLEDDLLDDSCLDTEQQMDENLDEHVNALGPLNQNSVPAKLIRSQHVIEKSPGGCIQLVQIGSCKKAAASIFMITLLCCRQCGGTMRGVFSTLRIELLRPKLLRPTRTCQQR